MTVMWLALGLGMLLLLAAVMHAVWPSILDKEFEVRAGKAQAGAESEDDRFHIDIVARVETAPRTAGLDESAAEGFTVQSPRPSIRADETLVVKVPQA